MKPDFLNDLTNVKIIHLFDWGIAYNANKTKQVYKKIELGSADSCNCDYCKNFSRNRNNLFPKFFLEILIELGIDPTKEIETYYIRQLSQNNHLYGGWFHFNGEILSSKCNDSDKCSFKKLTKDLQICLTSTIELPNPEFKKLHLVQLEFKTILPWVLNTPLKNIIHY
jgi:hypothetical protein